MASHFSEGPGDDLGDFGGNGTWGAFKSNGTFGGTFGDFGNATSGFGNGTMGGFCSADPFDFSCLMPEGAVVDYSDAGLGPRVRATAMAMAAIATLSVVFRLWSRKQLNGKLHMEDWIITSTIPLTWLASVCCWWGVKYGAGRHWWNIPKEMTMAAMTERSFPYIWLWGHCYWIIALLVKVSIIRFYLRLSPSQNFYRSCWFALAFVISSGLALGISAFFSCTPIKANWSTEPIIPKCFDVVAFYRAHSVIHIAGDLVVLVLPLPMLIRMDRPWAQKFHVLGVFLLGGFVAVCSIVRFVFILLTAQEEYMKDASYWGSYIMVWTTLELNVGIICSCLPAMKRGLSHLFPKFFALRTGSNRSGPPSFPIFTRGSGSKEDTQNCNPNNHIDGMDQLDSDDEEAATYHRRSQQADLEKNGCSRIDVMRQKSESEEQIMKFEMRVLRSSTGSGSTGGP